LLMAPWLDWIGRRSRLLVLALAGLVVAEYRTHQMLIVNLATVGAFLVAFWFSLPTRYVIQGEVDGAARRLRRLARKNWRDRRFVLMGESDSAAVTYVRQQGLEVGTVSCGWEKGDMTDIYENYKAIRSGKLLILGPPGSGKTLAALTLVTEILSFGLEAPDEWMLPIPVSIGGWDGTQELGEWLSDRLVEGYRIARPVARALVYSDYILPVLDGLDEADDQSHDRISTSQKILEQIRSSSDASDIARGALVMTCRSNIYKNLFDSGHSLRNAVVIEMKDLEPEAIRSYLHMRFKDDRAHNPYRSDPFASAIHQDDSCLTRALAKPLILTLAILVLKAEHSTPGRMARYRKESSLTNYLFRMLIPSAVRSNPRSPLPRVVGGVRKRTLPWWRSSAGAVAVVFALWAGMLRRPEPRSLRFRQFATPMGLLRLIAIAILGGLCALGGALDGGWRTAISSGVGGTIAFVVVIGLIGGIAEVVDPRWILRNDLLFGAFFGLGVSVAAALPGGLTGGIVTSLRLNKYLSIPGSACLAISIAIPAGIVLGSRCWTRHAFMVLLLAPKGRVPWRTMHFIKWCYFANLLRISGAGYELRHQAFVQALEPRIIQKKR
jgi:DNA polymerase III delta prime subunit